MPNVRSVRPALATAVLLAALGPLACGTRSSPTPERSGQPDLAGLEGELTLVEGAYTRYAATLGDQGAITVRVTPSQRIDLTGLAPAEAQRILDQLRPPVFSIDAEERAGGVLFPALHRAGVAASGELVTPIDAGVDDGGTTCTNDSVFCQTCNSGFDSNGNWVETCSTDSCSPSDAGVTDAAVVAQALPARLPAQALGEPRLQELLGHTQLAHRQLDLTGLHALVILDVELTANGASQSYQAAALLTAAEHPVIFDPALARLNDFVDLESRLVRFAGSGGGTGSTCIWQVTSKDAAGNALEYQLANCRDGEGHSWTARNFLGLGWVVGTPSLFAKYNISGQCLRSSATKPFTLTSFNCATSSNATGMNYCFYNLTATHDSASQWNFVADGTGNNTGVAFVCGAAAGLAWSSNASVKANVGWDLNAKGQKVNGKLDFTWTSGNGWFAQVTKERAGYIACPAP